MNFFVGTYKEYDAINAEEVSVIIPKVIETEKEYENALARINDLMDADPGTPEGDELELLVTLVEMYEKIEEPIDPPGSVEALKFR
jgi:HTH-type transcriptional regulator/antitoxin HigA